MNDKVITLPNREEMLKRLLEVKCSSFTQQKFYPILLESAGEKKDAVEVVSMLALAIDDYTEGLPPMISYLMYRQANHFIDALINDAEVAQQARDFLQGALQASNTD